MPGKIQIDPAHPIASLTAGDQQFTIGADTNHSKASISGVVVKDIPQMARNGVKHIMIEYPMDSMETLAEKYPGLAKAKTWDERLKVLEQEQARINQTHQAVTRQSGSREAEDATEVDRVKLASARLDLRANEVLEGVYASGPGRWTDDQIRERTKDFTPAGVDDPAQAARNFADTLIESRRAGIRVHLTGDRPDAEMAAATNIAGRTLTRFNEDNKKYADHYDNLTSKPGYMVPLEDREQYREYVDTVRTLSDEFTALTLAEMKLRDAPEKEQQRVDRIVSAAQGEKAYVQWGAAHAFKADDFNEKLDEAAAKRAREQGLPAPAAKTKVIELCDSEEDHFNRNPEQRSDEPDARLFIKEKKVEITPSGASALELKSGPQAGLHQDTVAEQYARLMSGNIIGSIRSGPQPDVKSDTAEPVTPAQQVKAAPSYTA